MFELLLFKGPGSKRNSQARDTIEIRSCLAATEMHELDRELLAKYATLYPRGNAQRKLAETWYGTAGFRMKASELPHIVFRMGLLACFRSQYCRAAIGLMLTASHNPVSDNGIKLIDPHGEVLDISWEAQASRLANCDDELLEATLRKLLAEAESENLCDFQPVVVLGRDTRPSCIALCEAAMAGARCFGARICDFGLVTTPMLHYMVRCTNDLARCGSGRISDVVEGESDAVEALRYEAVYGLPTLTGYLDKLVRNYVKLLRLFGVARNPRPRVAVDCANGVGYVHLQALASRISAQLLQPTLLNVGDGELNERCGADYVKQQQDFPANVRSLATERCVALDGDADRIVYFYADSRTVCRVLDGDKIALLLARFVARLLRDAETVALPLSFGVVQTAYANGASTAAIETVGCGVQTCCVPTGIKFLLAKATEYDVGVFFEANGHGTVLFSERLKRRLRDSLRRQYSVEVDRLLTTINIINETVGDSISDLLLIEAILAIDNMSIVDWDSLYADLPSRQLKVIVADKLRIRTTKDEQRVVQPAQLQTIIDQLVQQMRNYDGTFEDERVRCFVRPSGTEDVVRVYAEATLQSTADILAQKVAQTVVNVLADCQ